MTLVTPASAQAACFDPAIQEGSAAKDALNESLIVTQTAPPAPNQKIGNTVIGVATKGLYYGCQADQRLIAPIAARAKKFNLFLPLKGAPFQGFELDISTESRRVLAMRAIQVPWDVVDRSKGVTATCTPSTSTTFEGFLYGALRKAKSRRCTEVEIQALVGKTRTPARR